MLLRKKRLEIDSTPARFIFSDTIVGALDKAGIEYTISVPFERFTPLKGQIEQRCRWHALDTACDYFESHWKPKSWSRRHRLIFVRQKAKFQHKGPLQLDLFVPHEYGFTFKNDMLQILDATPRAA